MKLGITGSASYDDYDHFLQVVQAIPVPVTLIVTGGMEGVERMARRYAREMHLPCLIHHAQKSGDSHDLDWLRRRNVVLVNDADNVLALHYPGTYALALIRGAARAFGKPCKMVTLTRPVLTLEEPA